MFLREIDREHQAGRREFGRTLCPPASQESLRKDGVWSWPLDLRLLCWTLVAQHLYAPVVGVDYVDVVVGGDKHTGRELELFRAAPGSAEVVQQLPLLIYDLHLVAETIDNVEIVFAIDRDSLWSKHAGAAYLTTVWAASDLRHELAGKIEDLHTKIHGVDDIELLINQLQLSRKIEFTGASTALAKALENRALHVENENLLA